MTGPKFGSRNFPNPEEGGQGLAPPAPQALPRYVDNEDAGMNGSHGYNLNHLSILCQNARRGKSSKHDDGTQIWLDIPPRWLFKQGTRRIVANKWKNSDKTRFKLKAEHQLILPEHRTPDFTFVQELLTKYI